MKWSRFKRRLRNWKPIHLCWLFKKLGLPIPPYFIGGGSDFDLTGSRLANATRTWLENEDTDHVDWDKANPFIIAAMVECTSHNGASGTIQLRWRNVTDSGAFALLSSSGELNWGSGDITDLVNGNAVTSGESGCTPGSASTWQDGIERENANDVSTPTLDNEYTEHHWAIDCSGAHDGDEYEFEIYDSGVGSVGTCLASITMTVGLIQKNVTDTGSGTDATPAIKNSFSLSDTGSGIDATPAMKASIPISDGVSGTDLLAGLKNAFTIPDIGSGVDVLAGLKNSFTVSDNGSGIDAIIVKLFKIVTDTGSGVDAVSLKFTVTLSDTGTGVDTIANLLAKIPLGDTGSGVDALADLVNKFTIPDSGLGIDAVTPIVKAHIVDTGVGTDAIVSIAVKFTLADAGTAIDAITNAIAFLMADSGLGTDAIQKREVVSFHTGLNAIECTLELDVKRIDELHFKAIEQSDEFEVKEL